MADSEMAFCTSSGEYVFRKRASNSASWTLLLPRPAEAFTPRADLLVGKGRGQVMGESVPDFADQPQVVADGPAQQAHAVRRPNTPAASSDWSVLQQMICKNIAES